VRHPGTVWIEANWSTLPNNAWVAADQSGMVASADSMDALRSRLHALHRREDEVAIAFVTRDPI
jgi:hypothetical protein